MTAPQTNQNETDVEGGKVGEEVQLKNHERRTFGSTQDATAAGNADLATEAVTPRGADDTNPATPHARTATPLDAKPDQLAHKEEQAEDRQEALIDESVEESFPASDPPSAKRIT